MPDTYHFARQSDPSENFHFNRWPAPARGDDQAEIRVWHAMDIRPPPMSPQRRRAEAAWARVVQRAAP